MKKGLYYLGIASLVGCLFFGFALAGDSVRIGYVGPVSWDFGKTQIAAAKLAVQEVNKAGGILGTPVELIIADSELKAVGAANAVHKLVEVDRVDFLIGGYGSEETLAAREAACDLKKIAIFSGGASHEWITTTLENYGRYRYTFRNSIPDEIDGEARYVVDEEVPWLTNIIRGTVRIDKVKLAILTDAAKWQDACHNLFLKEFPEKGYEIVYQSRFSTTATDASVELTEIKKRGAHIIVGGMAYKTTLPLIRQWHDMKMPAIWAGVNVLAMSPKFWEQTGGKCVYASTYNFGAAHVPITPQTKIMWDYLHQTVGSCYFSSAGPYVSIWSIKHAADRSKTLETEAMIKAILEIKFDSVGGTIKYMANHSHNWGPVGTGAPIWTLQHQPGGKFVLVHPQKYADGNFMLPPWMIESLRRK